MGETWWIWLAFGLVLAILEVAIRLYVFLALAIASVLTGVMLWLGVGPAGWVGAEPANALLVCGGLAAAIWAGLRLSLGPPPRDED